MRTDLVHLLVGYDPETEREAYSHQLPPYLMSRVLKLAQPESDDPEAVATYPLALADVRKVWDMIGEVKRDERLEYFLESEAAVPLRLAK